MVLLRLSSQPCVLEGLYPGLLFTDREATATSATFQNTLAPVPVPLSLRPGDGATATLRWWTGGQCSAPVWEVQARGWSQMTPHCGFSPVRPSGRAAAASCRSAVSPRLAAVDGPARCWCAGVG